jgi:hypothetical protein
METKEAIPLTRKQKGTLLSPIPRTLTAILSTNELMAGAQLEQFLSHLVSSNTNMSFVRTYFGPGLWHQGQLYWDNIMGMKNSKGNGCEGYGEAHILYIPWFTGATTGGHWSLIVRYKNTHGKVALTHLTALTTVHHMHYRTHHCIHRSEIRGMM